MEAQTEEILSGQISSWREGEAAPTAGPVV